MKKTFRSYLAIWAVFLVVYNLICFITPNEMFGYVKIDKTFWVAYSFVTVSFVGQLICAFIAFKETNLNKFFYSIPLIKRGLNPVQPLCRS